MTLEDINKRIAELERALWWMETADFIPDWSEYTLCQAEYRRLKKERDNMI